MSFIRTDDLLDRHRAAQQLNISPEAFDELVAAGEIEPPKWTPDAVDAVIRRRREVASQ